MPKPRAYWIRLDDGVHDHPKTIGLATTLGVSRETAVGHLTRFWLWVMKYRPSGTLGSVPDTVLAEAAGWKGDPIQWCNALLENRFLTRRRHGIQAHGYAERNGYQLRETARNASRKRVDSRTNPAGYPHESRTNPAAQDVQDVPYVQDRSTETPCSPPAGDAVVALRDWRKQAPEKRAGTSPLADPTRRAWLEEQFGKLYEFYPRHVGKDAAWRAFLKLSPDADTLRAIGRDIKRRTDQGEWLPQDEERSRFIPHLSTYLNQRRWTDSEDTA